MRLPPVYQEQLERLRAPAWRERKQAVATLRRLVSHDRADQALMDRLTPRLLDGLLAVDALEGRAACHEVLVAIGPAAVAAVVERLDVPGPSRRLLVDVLGDIGDPSQAERLRALVRDGSADENLRGAAAHALGRLGRPEDVDVLVALLETPSDMLRNHAIEALREGGYAVPLERLVPLLAAPYTRKAAASLAGQSQDPAVIGVLLPLLDDAMGGVRAAAAGAIIDLAASLPEADHQRLRAELRQRGASTRERICRLVVHPHRRVRAAALRLAAMAGEAGAVAPLLEVMDDPLIQEEGLAMMTTLGSAGVEALAKAGHDVTGTTREHVLRLAGAVDAELIDDDLLESVTRGLSDPSEDTAVAAAETLASVGRRAAMPELVRVMAAPGRLGEAAADGLAAVVRRCRAEGDLDVILGTAWPHDGDLARNLCRLVGSLGSARYAPQMVSLLGSPDVRVRVVAATALGSVPGEHEGASALCFALTDEEPQVRAAACRSLGLLSAPNVVSALLGATSDRSALVRGAAVAALVNADNPVALPRLRAIIAEDPVPAVVVQAIAGLGSSGLEQDLTMLMSLVTSEDWEVVKASARALVRFPQHRATAALLGLLGHERWDVRWVSAEVLGERRDHTAIAPIRRALAAEPDPLVRQILGEAISRLES